MQAGYWLPQELQARRHILQKAQTSLANQMQRLIQAYLENIMDLEEYRQPLALFINPNPWLDNSEGRRYARKVQANDTVLVAKQRYYIGTIYARQYLAMVVEASTQQFKLCQKEREIGRVAIKGLHRGCELNFADYQALLVAEARRAKVKRTFYVLPGGEAVAAG